MMGNLLTEDLIETDRCSLSLPGLLAAMARREVAGFPALRPHQRPAWHMFLVQLAVLALSVSGSEEIPEDEEEWRAALRRLTKCFADDEPWCLVVKDRGCPAFLQPPDPGRLRWTLVSTPDALDMLITSKNHDLKGEVARQAAPQDWIFALVSLQTMEGYGGPGKYGIARMNGGSSSRVMIGLAPARAGDGAVDPAAWWRRDVAHLLGQRNPGLSGPALLWCLPWPEDQMLALGKLDPSFVEVCRRVRLEGRPESLRALIANSRNARVNSKEAKGVTGDPWAPVHIEDNKTLTLGEEGDWGYERLNKLLYSGDWHCPELAMPLSGEKDADMILIAEAFARGNCKTGGFKSRLIPVPKAVKHVMFETQTIDLAKEQVDLIAEFDRALRDGLVLVAANGDREKRSKWTKSEKAKKYGFTKPAHVSLSSIADALFFPTLWDKLADGTEQGRIEKQNHFARTLAQAARDEFMRAAPGIPCAQIMRPKAETRGRAAFERGIFRIFDNMGVKEVQHV